MLLAESLMSAVNPLQCREQAWAKRLQHWKNEYDYWDRKVERAMDENRYSYEQFIHRKNERISVK